MLPKGPRLVRFIKASMMEDLLKKQADMLAQAEEVEQARACLHPAAIAGTMSHSANHGGSFGLLPAPPRQASALRKMKQQRVNKS